MSFVKVDDKCPDISVRRKNNTEHDYIVKVNGDVVSRYEDDDGNWSRRIYISKKHGVVIKIDEDYYRQSRNEIVFWTEVVKGEHKRFFAPVLAWGTTSCRAWGTTKKIFYCVQKYIPGAKEYYEYAPQSNEVKRKYKALIDVVDQYNISDFHWRQVKVSKYGAVRVHDYGLFGNYDTDDLKSDRIPSDASLAAKNMKRILEKVGA